MTIWNESRERSQAVTPYQEARYERDERLAKIGTWLFIVSLILIFVL
jgi:heme/copper-type cytochrome/quinol oxidase subunit 3